MQLVQQRIPSGRRDLEHQLTVEFVWLDQTYHRSGDLFSPYIMGVFLFNRYREAETLRKAWISYRDVLEKGLYKAVWETSGKTFPKFTYNLRLGELSFEQGRVLNPNGGMLLYCSSRADLEERLGLANTDGREILVFRADGKFYSKEKDAQEHLRQVGEDIGRPFDDHLKQHPQQLLDFTKNRVRRVYVSYGENGARESIAYPELLGKEISVQYVDAVIADSVQVERDGDNFMVLLDYQLTREPLKVVRGALCIGLSRIVNNGNRDTPLSTLQMDAFARGFPKEVAAYTSYIEAKGSPGDGLTSEQIIAIVRQSQSILGDNIHKQLYSNMDGYIPRKID